MHHDFIQKKKNNFEKINGKCEQNKQIHIQNLNERD